MSKYISQYTAQTSGSSGDVFLFERSSTYYKMTIDNLGPAVAAFTDIGDLANVSSTGPSSGQTLTWNGSAWAPATPSTSEFSDGGEAGGANRTLGNTDAFSLGFLTNNVVRINITSGGAVGIGSAVTPGASALLQIDSTTQGFLLPRMTAAQWGAIGSKATGLLAYQTDSNDGFVYYDGASSQYIATKSEKVAGGAAPALSFDKDYQHGDDTTPCTGNPTFSLTNATEGSVVVMVHNDASEPTLPGSARELDGSATYATSADNFYYLMYIDATNIVYTIRIDA